MTEQDHMDAIYDAVKAAERRLALSDAPDYDDDPEGFEAAYETVFHCETCMVRETWDVIWPAVQIYIDWLKAQIPAEVTA
jgi:hypothetical protein